MKLHGRILVKVSVDVDKPYQEALEAARKAMNQMVKVDLLGHEDVSVVSASIEDAELSMDDVSSDRNPQDS